VDRDDTLRRMYRHFNAREIHLAADFIHADVDWPNALEGTRIHTLAEVLDYWRGQFAEFDPRVEPVEFSELPDGRLRVLVHQTLNDLNGDLIGQGRVFHDYAFRDGLVERMDIVAAEGG
jgi:hypothetical protein